MDRRARTGELTPRRPVGENVARCVYIHPVMSEAKIVAKYNSVMTRLAEMDPKKAPVQVVADYLDREIAHYARVARPGIAHRPLPAPCPAPGNHGAPKARPRPIGGPG